MHRSKTIKDPELERPRTLYHASLQVTAGIGSSSESFIRDNINSVVQTSKTIGDICHVE